MHFVKSFFDVANQSAAAALNRKIIEISLRNFNSGLDLGKSLAGARNPFEVVTLVASFWWKQFDELRLEAEVVQNRLFGFSVAQLKFKSAEPLPDSRLCEPAKNSTTLLTKSRGPKAPDRASPRPQQNSGTQKVEVPPVTAPAAGSEVRAPTEKRLKGRTPEKRSTSLQTPKSNSRVPAQKQRKQKLEAAKTTLKTRSSSRSVTRLQHKRQTKKQKKVAPKGVPQNLATDIKFGALDGNPVRFTNHEAWWLVDGAWRAIPPGEVLSDAAVMREVRFKERFPHVPLLPKKAFHAGKR
jgi:hypothetical protein